MPIVPAPGPVAPGSIPATSDSAGDSPAVLDAADGLPDAPAGDLPNAPLAGELLVGELLVGPVQRAAGLPAAGLPIVAEPSPVAVDQRDRPPVPITRSVTATEQATPAKPTVTVARLVGDWPQLGTAYGDGLPLPPAPRVQPSGHEPAAPAPYPLAGTAAASHVMTGLALISPAASTVDVGRPAPLTVSRTAGGSATASVPLPVVNTVNANPPEPASGPMLQRQAAESEPASPSTVDTTATNAPAGPPTGAPTPAAEPDELLKKLFDPLLRRLKAELRLDRERRGALTDLRH